MSAAETSVGKLCAAVARQGKQFARHPSELVGFLKTLAKSPIEYEAAVQHANVPQVTFAQLFPDFEPVPYLPTRADMSLHAWNVKLHEKIYLGFMVKAMNANRIFEIGTFDGGTTRFLAESAGDDAKVFTIDLPEEEFDSTQGPHAFTGKQVGEKYRDSPAVNKITQIRCNANEFDFAPFARTVDLVFVDAAHDYQHGIVDSSSALQMVRPGGLIVWHDFEPYWSGLVRAICEKTRGFGLRRLAGTSMAILKTDSQLT